MDDMIVVVESDINELEMSLDHANKSNAEEAKQIKRSDHAPPPLPALFFFRQVELWPKGSWF